MIMNITKYLLSGCVFICSFAAAQNHSTVSSIELTTTPAQSYIVTDYGKILPGVTISGSSPFFIKATNNLNSLSGNTQSYLRTETILIPGVTQATIQDLSISQKTTSFLYTDAFGRDLQSVIYRGSPQQNDIILPYVYDNTGKTSREYLPYVHNQQNGQYRKEALTNGELLNYYSNTPEIPSDSRPFKESFFDSPVSQSAKVYGPGQDWKNLSVDKSIKTTTRFSLATENIIKWNYYTTGLPSKAGMYADNELTVSETIDEDDYVTKMYTDQLGRTILTKVGQGNTWKETYSIYSPTGLLMYVIQPEGVVRLTAEFDASGADKQNFLDRWSFQYQYDDEQRAIAKRTPGTGGWIYYVYDKWNRLVLTQDAEQRTRNEYLFTKYDRFNRPIITGLFKTTSTIALLRGVVANSTGRYETEINNSIGYTLTSSYPFGGVLETDLFSILYYDNYDFLSYTGWDNEALSYSYVNVTGYPQKTNDAANEILTIVKGHATGSKTRVLNQNQSRWLNAVTYYDKKYNNIQAISEDFIGGTSRITKKPSFTGQTEKQQAYNTFANLTVEKLFSYDHAGRLMVMRHSINGATPVIISSNKYNELGTLIEQNLHSTDGGITFLQSVDYKYNIRGQTTHINNSALSPETGDTNADLFGMQLSYNSAPVTVNGFNTKPYYNGDISFLTWKTDTKKSIPVENIYGLDYDVFGQLKQSYYAARSGSTWGNASGMFDEQIKGYDNNGNITGISRYKKVEEVKTNIDNLTYSYLLNGKESNQLIGVDDPTGNKLGFSPAIASVIEEYQYDNNGNLKFDHNKSISAITYNHLNLPVKIEFTRSDGTKDQIEYVYDASGSKLKRTVTCNNTMVWWTDYVSGMQFDKGQLSFFQTDIGRVVNNNGIFEYEYFLKDHLGNVRVAFTADKETVTYHATMELALASAEEDPAREGFKNIGARRINPGSASLNYTKASSTVLTPNRSASCNGYNSQPVGPAKEIRVLNGDVVYMEVFAKYTQTTGSASVITAAILGAAVNAALGVTSAENPTLYNGINSNAPLASGGIPAGAIQPKAYLAFLFFDDNNVFQRSGAVGITTDAYNAFEKLKRSFTADKNGRLYIYVASESNVAVANVYFDEFHVVHQKNNTVLQVTQASDYYPFGLAFNEYQGERLKVVSTSPLTYEPVIYNRYGYQGQELQKDLDLNWYQFEARMYEPALAKFNSVDPLASKYFAQTPYNLTFNNPYSFVDPDGRTPNPAYNMGYAGNPYQNAYNATWSSYQSSIYQHYSTGFAIQQQLNQPFMQDWRQHMAHLQGNYYQDRPRILDELAGEYGRTAQIGAYSSVILSSFFPGTYIATGLLDARKGNYGSAMLNFAAGVSELGSLSRAVKTTEMVTLYRNFGFNEYNSVKSTRAFSILKGGYEEKQFWIGEEGLKFWQNSPFGKPVTAELRIPKSYVTPGNPNYIFRETGYDVIGGVPHIDGFPGGSVLPENLSIFNSVIEFKSFYGIYPF
jgi:RHS repeat-associated protein